MPKTCARCGTLAGRGRELRVPGEWVDYLRSERGLSSPVGMLAMPLCTDCYREVDDLREATDGDDAASVEERNELLDALDLDALIDEG